jgi:hypothetical protein
MNSFRQAQTPSREDASRLNQIRILYQRQDVELHLSNPVAKAVKEYVAPGCATVLFEYGSFIGRQGKGLLFHHRPITQHYSMR